MAEKPSASTGDRSLRTRSPEGGSPLSWTYYTCRSDRLIQFGRKGIVVCGDGSKTVVKLPLMIPRREPNAAVQGNSRPTISSSSSSSSNNNNNNGGGRSPLPSLCDEQLDLSNVEQYSCWPTPFDSLWSEAAVERCEIALPSERVRPEQKQQQQYTAFFRQDLRSLLVSPPLGSDDFHRPLDLTIGRRRRRRPVGSTLQSAASSSTVKKKKRRRRRMDENKTLPIVLSIVYFIFLVTVGVVICVADLILPQSNIGQVFSVYLLIPALAYCVVLHIDLLRRQTKKQLHPPLSPAAAAQAGNSLSSDGATLSSPQSQSTSASSAISASHDESVKGYAFNRGRHSGSFFLKIGAAGFCFGHLIQSCLMFGRQIAVHLTSDEDDDSDGSSNSTLKANCSSTAALMFYCLVPVFSFYQLFLLFKYSNVMIYRRQTMARFGMMHCMACGLYLWLWFLREETIFSLYQHSHHHHHQLQLQLQQQNNAAAAASATHHHSSSSSSSRSQHHFPSHHSGNTHDGKHHQQHRPFLVNITTSRQPITTTATATTEYVAKWMTSLLWNGTTTTSLLYDGDDGNGRYQCYQQHANNNNSSSTFAALIQHVSPYLYPFSIEYHIITVGIWFIMWLNIGSSITTAASLDDDGTRSDQSDCAAEDECHDDIHRVIASERRRPINDDNPPLAVDSSKVFVHSSSSSSNDNKLIIYANCASANRGLFVGLVVMVLTAIKCICASQSRQQQEEGGEGSSLTLHTVTDAWTGVVLVAMMAAAGLALRQLGRLDVNPHPISQLDDLLLFACLPSFFIYGIASLVPAMAYSNYTSLVITILQVSQVILQTPLIIDGLRRCSSSNSSSSSPTDGGGGGGRGGTKKEKPGRELVTFLVICNLSVWIMETFEMSQSTSSRSHHQSDRIHFYGHSLWTVLSHSCFPLTLFYRFHSASCLVDIWTSAYDDDERNRGDRVQLF